MIKKHLLPTLLIIVLGMLTSAKARLQPNPGEFGVEAEWIFFRASIDNPYFALAGSFTSSSSLATLENNDFDYQSGYRVGAAYHFCCPDLTAHIRWTQHWSDTSRDLSGQIEIGAISPTSILSSHADVKNSLDVYALDAVFETQVFCEPCCFDLFFFGGLQYSAAEGTQRLEYQGQTAQGQSQASSHERTCFYGVGPEVGLDFSYDLGCGFGITGNGRGGLLVSHMEARVETKQTTPLPRVVINKNSIEKNWRVVPSCDMRFGVHYGCKWTCASMELEVGYEALSLFRALPVTNNVIAINRWNIIGYSNVDFHGPYVNFAVTF